MLSTWIYLFLACCFLSGISSYVEYEEEIKKYIDIECTKKDPTLLHLTTFLNNHQACVMTSQIEMVTSYLDKNFNDLQERLCGNNPVMECFKKTDGEIEKCVKSGQKRIPFLHPFFAIKAGKYYLCEDDRRKIKEFLEEKSTECVKSKMDKILQCNADNHNMNDNFFLKSFEDKKPCLEKAKWATCIVDTLNECEDHTAKVIAERTFREIFIATDSCNGHIKNDYPQLSGTTANSINILTFVLILAVPFTFKF